MRKLTHNLKLTENKKRLSYLGLFFVVFIWGIAPLITLKLYDYYSPTFRLFACQLILVITYLCVSGKKIKQLNRKYFKTAIPLGVFLGLADILQKIGLQYTTPAKYAFLENLSCVVVPFLTFFFIGKKPALIKILSSVLCLVSVFILSGVSFKDNGLSFGIGEILCAAAGLFYGVNIAGTGAFAKNFEASLYLMLQALVTMIMSLLFTIALAHITTVDQSGNLIPLEKLRFSLNFWPIIFLVFTTVIVSGLCWIIRTNSMKYIDAAAVAIIMPFSAVVTSVISIILGKDALSLNLVIGGTIGIAAIILSEINFNDKKNKK